jgi:hypothetical protein
MNSTIRASKKGEVLVMRDLVKLEQCPIDDPQDACVTATAADEGLAEVFAEPVDKVYFAAFRDIFPVA